MPRSAALRSRFAPLRALALVLSGCVALASCAPAEAGTGPTPDGAPALIDVSVGNVTIAGVELQETVSVLVRQANGAVLGTPSVSWTSDKPSVVEVTGSGASAVLTARGAGTARVRATSGSAGGEISVRVLSVQGVTILESNPTVRVGEPRALSAMVEAEPGAVRTVKWSTDNPAIATVSAQGVVTGVTEGTTLVRATASGDPRVSTTASLTVTPGRVIEVNPAAALLWVGDQKALATSTELRPGESPAVAWVSSDPSVATVNASGIVTAVAVGQTTIRATLVADARVRGQAVVQVLPARRVTVTPTSASVRNGESRKLTADVTIEPGLSTLVSWRSSNPSVVSVAQDGTVTGLSMGAVTVTAMSVTDTLRKGTATVTVQPSVLGVRVSPTDLELITGTRDSLDAEVEAEGGLPRTVTWRTGNPAVASVSGSGVVTAVGPGQTSITAVSTMDTTKRASAAVRVLVAPEVGVSPSQATVALGAQRTFTATINAPGLSNDVIWRSGNSAIASVSQSGVVTGISAGSTTISVIAVADTTRRASATVHIIPIVRAIAVTPTTGSIFIGQSQALTAQVQADPGLSTAVTWRTSNPAVATVNNGGFVVGVAAGEATITAVSVADTTKRASAEMAVASRPVAVSVMPAGVSLGLNQSATLTATVTGNPGTSNVVTWTSANPTVATVSSTGTVTGIAQGTTTVRATAVADPTKSFDVSVAVNARLATAWSASRVGGGLHEDVLSIAPFGSSSAFAVNVVGDVFRWDGISWTLSATGAQFGTRFQAVHGSSASHVVAVGSNGVIARFNGTGWSQMLSGVSTALLDVVIEGASSGYAVGAGGTILRYSGSTWTPMSSGSTETLNGVWASGADAVVVGTGGEVRRLSGNVWERDDSPTIETLYGIAGTSKNALVAVGTFGTVLRFDGTAWTKVTTGVTADLYSVDGGLATGGRMYVASDNGLLQLDGTTLSAVATPYQPRMFSAAVDGTGQVWVGGQRGAVQRGTGGTFTTLSLAPDLLDVWSTAANNAWAVGEFGFVYRWNGTTWQRQTTPTTVTLNSVWAANATDAFVAGDNGTVLRLMNGTWTPTPLPSTSNVYSIWGTSATNVYAATASGQLYHFNGTSWTLATSAGGALWAIHGSSPSDVYVSGESGTLLRFNGSAWTALSPTSNGILAGLWAGGSSSIFTVGADGAGAAGIAYRFDGSSWQSQSTGTSRVLTSVWGPNGNDLYATGDMGTMLRFDGTSWQSMPTGTSDLLWSVSGAPSGVGGAFAVGYNGTIVAGAGTSGLAASRVGPVRTSLEPGASARGSLRAKGPLPDGAARKNRKSAAGRAAATKRLTPMLKFARKR